MTATAHQCGATRCLRADTVWEPSLLMPGRKGEWVCPKHESERTRLERRRKRFKDLGLSGNIADLIHDISEKVEREYQWRFKRLVSHGIDPEFAAHVARVYIDPEHPDYKAARAIYMIYLPWEFKTKAQIKNPSHKRQRRRRR